MKRLVYLALSLVLMTVSLACLAEPPKFVAIDIPFAQQPDGLGYLDSIYKEISSRSGVAIDYDVVPFPRAMTMFDQKQVDCLLPGSTKRYFDKISDHEIIRSNPFSVSYLTAITIEKNKHFLEREAFEGLALGYIRSFNKWDYSNKFGLRPSRQMIADTQTQLLDMLRVNRVDIILGWYPPTAMRAAQDLNIDLSYDLERSLLIDYLIVSCHKSEKTNPVITKFNTAILDMWEDGSIRSLHPAELSFPVSSFPPPM